MADNNKTTGKMYIFFNIEYHFNIELDFVTGRVIDSDLRRLVMFSHCIVMIGVV